MYVSLTGPKGYEHVVLKEAVRDPRTNKKKEYVIKNYGSLKSCQESDPDFLEKLKADIKKEREEAKADKTITLTTRPRTISVASDQRASFYFGHMIVKWLWEEMSLDSFFKKYLTKKNKDALIIAIYNLLALRLGSPASIRESSEKQKGKAGMKTISLDVLYSVLDVLYECKDEVVRHLSKFFEKNTERNLKTVSYDVTNYYFESQKEGQFRLFGFSKENKHNEVIVVMGLLIDSNGIPVTMRLFPGNTMDQNTLQDSIDDLKDLYGFEKITVIADRGMNSKENLVFLTSSDQHFLISYTLKKASAKLKKECLNGNWQETIENENGEIIYATKVLDTTVEAKIELTEEEREKLKEERKAQKIKGRVPKYKTVTIDAKLHVSYSAKRAAKDAHDRERAVAKAKKKIEDGTASQSSKYGCNKYIDFKEELKVNGIDEERIKEEAQWDGIYAVITDNPDLTSEEVFSLYKTQWKIEECFRILKTDLEARPVYVWTDDHIYGHFVLCYLALCMIRYLQYYLKTEHKIEMSAARIMDCIREPLAVVSGEMPKVIITPTNLSEDFITVIDKLGFRRLETEMTQIRFRAITKLDLLDQLKELD